MLSLRSFARPVAVALALALAATPMMAFADGRAPVGHGAKEHRKFPLKADEFQQRVEKRIARARERLNQMLAKRSVPEAVQAQVKKDFEAGAVQVREAATRAGADGTVTREEAKQVRALAKDLKRQLRAKYFPGKGKERGHDA